MPPSSWRLVPVAGKRPLLRRWPELASSDRAQWRAWLEAWPHAGLAVATGPGSGVLALDIDAPVGGRADGYAALAELEARLGELPAETVEAATPAGGRHLFFGWPPGVPRIPSRPLARGVDVKASGGLAALPTGRRTPGRVWVRSPRELEPAELPARWLAALLPPVRPPPPPPPLRRPLEPSRTAELAERVLERAAGRVRAAAVGARHHALVAASRLAGGAVAGLGLDPSTAAATLRAAAAAAGLEPSEAEAAIGWGLEHGRAAPVRR